MKLILAVTLIVAGAAILVYQMLRVPCPKQQDRVEYKFLPRDLDMQMRDASSTYSFFRPMFEETTVGVR